MSSEVVYRFKNKIISRGFDLFGIKLDESSMAANSWEGIFRMIKAFPYEESLPRSWIGQTKRIGGDGPYARYHLRLVDARLARYDLYDDEHKSTHYVFQFVESPFSAKYTTTNGNIHRGFGNNSIYTTVNAIYDDLPKAMKDAIVRYKVPCNAYENIIGSIWRNETYDSRTYIFIPSEREIFGEDIYGYTGTVITSGNQRFLYYEDNEASKRIVTDINGNAQDWMLRTVKASTQTDTVIYINTAGNCTYANGNVEKYILPCFAV